MRRTKYKLNPTNNYTSDVVWVIAIVVILVLISLFGYKLLEYVSTNNVLKGEF